MNYKLLALDINSKFCGFMFFPVLGIEPMALLDKYSTAELYPSFQFTL